MSVQIHRNAQAGRHRWHENYNIEIPEVVRGAFERPEAV